jgi:ferritin-like metal-binding protein YciE
MNASARHSGRLQTSNKTMSATKLSSLFEDQIADVLYAERRITEALPKMIKSAQAPDLKEGLQHHLEETKNHITRLERVSASIGRSGRGKKCPAILGIIEEAEEMIEECKDSNAIDAGIIAAGQKVEHYEIASYGTLVAWAEQLGNTEAVELLSQTLEEEKNADATLTAASQAANAAA